MLNRLVTPHTYPGRLFVVERFENGRQSRHREGDRLHAVLVGIPDRALLQRPGEDAGRRDHHYHQRYGDGGVDHGAGMQFQEFAIEHPGAGLLGKTVARAPDCPGDVGVAARPGAVHNVFVGYGRAQ